MKPSRPVLFLTAAAFLLVAIILVVHRIRGNDAPPPDTASADTAPPSPTTTQSSRGPRPNPREADRLLAAEGATTDVTLSTFPIREYQQLRPPAGKAAGAPAGEAYIHVPSAGRRVAMEANQLGEFPTVETRLNDTVGVRLSLDSVAPGTPVRVVILDGGTFPAAEGVSQVLEAADWRGVAFEYTTSGNIGTHRVLVQAVGQPSRIFDFSAIAANES